MGQYTIKDIQDQAELLKADVQRIYRSLYIKLGFFPKSLDQVPYYIIQRLFPSPTKEPLTITPSTEQQEFTTPENIKYDPIIVNGVTSDIDGNIVPENIKEGITILGVAGTLSNGGVDGSGTFIVPSDMKFGYSNFVELPSYFDFRNVTDMNHLFCYCTKLTTIPQIDTSNVTDMSYLFHECNSLTSVPQLVTTNVQNMTNMFYNCSQLTGIFQMDTSNVQSMNSMFAGCTNLVDVPQLVTTNVSDMSNMFSGCSSLATIPQMSTSNVSSMNSMFSGCSNLTTIPQMDTSNVSSMNQMFVKCINLQSIPLLDTSKITNMEDMFHGCESLTEIPLLDTSNVQIMAYMFSECRSLTTIPLLNTSNVYTMVGMFMGCTNLTTIPQIDVSNVDSMEDMFYNCSNLQSVPQLNTHMVSNMNYLFNSCISLTTVEGIDFSGLTSELTYLFGYTSSMPKLTRFIVNGMIDVSISDNYSIKALTAIDYESVKSILAAADRTGNTNAKELAFNRTMTDQNGELAALVASCTSKGWTISGLTLQ